MDWNMDCSIIQEAIIQELYRRCQNAGVNKWKNCLSTYVLIVKNRCKQSQKKRKEKDDRWYKKTTRNCFFNEHFNIENDSGTLQNSAIKSWKQQTERRNTTAIQEAVNNCGPRSSKEIQLENIF